MRIVPSHKLRVKVGETYGRLTILGPEFYSRPALSRARRYVVAQCRCGRITAVDAVDCRRGHVSSCGCGSIHCGENCHFESGTPLYKTWAGMIQRCTNPESDSYSRYGRAGIAVCEEWRDYRAFRNWAIASGYREGLTIDRRKNELGYFPGNCRWATRTEQTMNRRGGHGSPNPYKGLKRRGRTWQARIAANGQSHYLGSFPDAESAALAYDQAAKRLHGEFACLNFPETFSDSAPSTDQK